MASKIALDKDLLSILLTESFDKFTVLELRGAYLAKLDTPTIDKVEARRYVYRHILRLVKKGLLLKKQSPNQGRTYYAKTDEFSIDKFKVHNQTCIKAQAQPDTSQDSVVQKLTERLSRYRSELLIALGETEEYKSLHEEFPVLKQDLQDRYDSARDHCSKIHGKIKAIESLIRNTLSGDNNSAIA